MIKNVLSKTKTMVFVALFAVLALSACAGSTTPGASNSGASSVDALTGGSGIGDAAGTLVLCKNDRPGAVMMLNGFRVW